MKILLIISGIFSSIVSSIMSYIAVDHNPMETYCKYDTNTGCTLVLSNVAGLWLTWFFAIFFALSLISIITVFLYRKLLSK